MGNTIQTCCDPNLNDDKTFTAPLSDPNDVGGVEVPASDSENKCSSDIAFECPTEKPPAVIKIEAEELLRFLGKRPTDTESLASGTSSNGSDLTSPGENLPEPLHLQEDNYSETPLYNDNSEPPSLTFREQLIDKSRKSTKQVSFANFAQVLEEAEVFKHTPHDQESPGLDPAIPSLPSSYSHDNAIYTLYTPSMKGLTPHSVRSVQSTGELPSTPSMNFIYLENHMEVKSNFYTQPTRGADDDTMISFIPQPDMCIDSSPNVLDTLEVPQSSRSVGTLPPSPILNNLFLGDAEGSEQFSKEHSDSYEPKPNVLWGMPESDTESSDAEDLSLLNRESISDDSYDTTSMGGDEFGVSKAWFTASSIPQSPDSYLSYSFGGEEMEI